MRLVLSLLATALVGGVNVNNGGRLADNDPFFGQGKAAVVPGQDLIQTGRVVVQQVLAQAGEFVPHPLERAMFAEESKKQWSYDVFNKQSGPLVWDQLGNPFNGCKQDDSTSQSPINLADLTVASTRMPSITPNYNPGQLLVYNTGNYLRLAVNQGSTLMWGDKPYELVYISIHTPAEHKLAGEPVAAEIQYVHKAMEGQDLVVLSVLHEVSAEKSPLIDHVLDSIPTAQNQKLTPRAIDLQSTVPVDVTQYDAGTRIGYPFLTYEGTLTTPPCRDNVRWFVLTKPAPITKDQLGALTSKFSAGSARPIQNGVDGCAVEMKA